MPHVTLGSFSMDAPEGWTLSTVILVGPMDQEVPGRGMPTAKAVKPFQRNLIATMEQVGAEVTPEIYVKRQIEGLKQAGVSRQDGAPSEKLKLKSGTEGLLVEQIIVGPTGERVRQMQLVIIKDGVAHTVIASHLDGASFERARSDFRGMLLSFS